MQTFASLRSHYSHMPHVNNSVLLGIAGVWIFSVVRYSGWETTFRKLELCPSSGAKIGAIFSGQEDVMSIIVNSKSY
jgi:hypothetical protein